MISIIELVGKFALIISAVLFIWFAWLSFSFGKKLAKGKRLTIRNYRKTRFQSALLAFIAAFLFSLGGLILYGDINIEAENLGFILKGSICFASLFTGMMVLVFINSFRTGAYAPDDEES